MFQATYLPHDHACWAAQCYQQNKVRSVERFSLFLPFLCEVLPSHKKVSSRWRFERFTCLDCSALSRRWEFLRCVLGKGEWSWDERLAPPSAAKRRQAPSAKQQLPSLSSARPAACATKLWAGAHTKSSCTFLYIPVH